MVTAWELVIFSGSLASHSKSVRRTAIYVVIRATTDTQSPVLKAKNKPILSTLSIILVYGDIFGACMGYREHRQSAVSLCAIIIIFGTRPLAEGAGQSKA